MITVDVPLMVAHEDCPIHDPEANFPSSTMVEPSGLTLDEYENFISAFKTVEDDLEQVIYFEGEIENKVVRVRLTEVLKEYSKGGLSIERNFVQLLNKIENKRVAALEKYFIIQHNNGPIIAVIKAHDKRQAGAYFHAEVNGVNVPMLNRGMVSAKEVDESFGFYLINSGVTSNA